MSKIKNKELFLIAHNVRSILNVGSFFRTADGAGVKKIYLCGYTPTPTQHPEKIGKTALNAQKFVEWEYAKYATTLIKRLRKEGVRVVALEQSKKSKNLFSYKPKFPTALVVGNENRGLARSILKECNDV
ncbi:RNA methyltransferase, partial [Candidatus Woesearchaeota archaeon]|nr:RNA methyltransferase [Candidatus Woesearchaeota archaeon]